MQNQLESPPMYGPEIVYNSCCSSLLPECYGESIHYEFTPQVSIKMSNTFFIEVILMPNLNSFASYCFHYDVTR